jgi:hypothetical protein
MRVRPQELLPLDRGAIQAGAGQQPPKGVRNLRQQEGVDGWIAVAARRQVLPWNWVQLDVADTHVMVHVAHERGLDQNPPRELALEPDCVAPRERVLALDREDGDTLAERSGEAQRSAGWFEHASREGVREIGVERQPGIQRRHEQRRLGEARLVDGVDVGRGGIDCEPAP